MQELATRGLGRNHISASKTVLRSFVDYCEERNVKAPRTVTPEIVHAYLRTYEQFTVSYRRSVHCYLRRFLDYADNRSMKDLYMPIRGDDSRRNVHWLSREQAEQLYQLIMTPGACSARQVLLVAAGLLQCCRRIETLRLTYGEVKDALKTGKIRLFAKHRTRLVRLQDEFAQILENYLASHDGADDAPLIGVGKTRSDDLLNEASELFGAHLTFHMLRRTGLTLMYEDAGETYDALQEVGRFAGHNHVETTRKYICLDIKRQAEIVSKYRLSHRPPTQSAGAPPLPIGGI